MLPDMSRLSISDCESIAYLQKLRIAKVGGVDSPSAEASTLSSPLIEVLKPYATDIMELDTEGRFIEWKDALHAIGLIEKRMKEGSSAGIFWDIKREDLSGGLRLIFNESKKCWFFIPKAHAKTEKKGACKRGRKAILLFQKNGEWSAEIVWYVRPISRELSDKFLIGRAIDNRIKKIFTDNKTNPFVQLVADFNIEKSEGDDTWVERRAFYKYYPKDLLQEIEDGDLLEWRAVDIACQLIQAVHRLHFNNIVLRDLKPDNILLDGNTPKFCDTDFVLDEEMVSKLKEGDIAGTSYYIAPEFVKALRQPVYKFPKGLEALKANDMFALGCTLNHLCADGKDVPWFSEKELKTILGYQKKRDSISKKIYPFQTIRKAQSRSTDGIERIRYLSRWMLNGSPKHRATAEKALEVVKKI